MTRPSDPLGDVPSPPQADPRFSFDPVEEQVNRTRPPWKAFAGVAAVVVFAGVGGFFLTRQSGSAVFDFERQARLVAEAINPIHARDCRIYIGYGTTSEANTAEIEKKAQEEVAKVRDRGADAAAYAVDEVPAGSKLKAADGSSKPPTYIGTLVAVTCSSG